MLIHQFSRKKDNQDYRSGSAQSNKHYGLTFNHYVNNFV